MNDLPHDGQLKELPVANVEQFEQTAKMRNNLELKA